jgi:hypothetical protein
MHKRHMTAQLDDSHRGLAPFRHRLLLGSWLAGMAITAVTALPAKAAETSAAAASALKVLAMPLAQANGPAPAATPDNAQNGPTPAARSITVQKGESIDAVIRRGLPGLPLKEDFMRQALAKANPKIFPKGQTYPVKPGTLLMLPSHDDLRQLILAQNPAAAALFQAPPADSSSTDAAPGLDKRRWVRFP